jgi:hypothetical protein
MASVGARGAEVGNGPLILAFQVRQGDSEIAHGHVRGAMTEEFQDAGKAYASAEHKCGVDMSKPMRDDPRRDSCRFADLVAAFPSARPCQKEAVGTASDRSSAKIGGAAPVGRPMNPPEQRDMNCPFPQERQHAGNRKIDRRTRRCAYRCCGVARVHSGQIVAPGQILLKDLVGD